MTSIVLSGEAFHVSCIMRQLSRVKMDGIYIPPPCMNTTTGRLAEAGFDGTITSRLRQSSLCVETLAGELDVLMVSLNFCHLKLRQ